MDRKRNEQATLEHRLKTHFLDAPLVRQVVAGAFDRRRYRSFDPAFGDSGCPARPIMLTPLFASSRGFEELGPDQRTFVTLCYVFGRERFLRVDRFGLGSRMMTTPSGLALCEAITTERGASVRRAGLCKPRDEAHQALRMMFSRLNCRLLRAAARRSRLERDFRQQPIARNGVVAYPASCALRLLERIAADIALPVLFKATRLEIVDGEPRLQGITLLPRVYGRDTGRLEPVDSVRADALALVIETFALKNDAVGARFAGGAAMLDSARGFADFCDALGGLDLRDFVLKSTISDDMAKGRGLGLSHDSLQLAAENEYAYSPRYVFDWNRHRGAGRRAQPVPLGLLHFYLSDRVTEARRIRRVVGAGAAAAQPRSGVVRMELS